MYVFLNLLIFNIALELELGGFRWDLNGIYWRCGHIGSAIVLHPKVLI